MNREQLIELIYVRLRTMNNAELRQLAEQLAGIAELLPELMEGTTK